VSNRLNICRDAKPPDFRGDLPILNPALQLYDLAMKSPNFLSLVEIVGEVLCYVRLRMENVYFYVLKCPEKAFYSPPKKVTISSDFMNLISLFLACCCWQPCHCHCFICYSNYCLHVIVNSYRDICYGVDMQAVHLR